MKSQLCNDDVSETSLMTKYITIHCMQKNKLFILMVFIKDYNRKMYIIGSMRNFGNIILIIHQIKSIESLLAVIDVSLNKMHVR